MAATKLLCKIHSDLIYILWSAIGKNFSHKYLLLQNKVKSIEPIKNWNLVAQIIASVKRTMANSWLLPFFMNWVSVATESQAS